MKNALKPLVIAMLFATVQLAGAANTPTTKTALPQVVTTTTAKNSPIEIKAPDDWILFDQTTYTPVADAVSRHLDAARKAFDAKDTKTAATEMHAVAEELTRQSARAGIEGRATAENDRELLTSDKKYTQDSVARLKASALKVSQAADGIESGKIKTKIDLDKAIDKATRADMERRWRVSELADWYPVTEEPQRHFTDAVAEYAKKDFKAAADDVRKATSFLRLEASRASGDAYWEIHRSIIQLNKIASSVEKGTANEEQAMINAFAKANHALALHHRAKAADSWAHKEYEKAGYELKASARGLESAGSWVGGEMKAGATTTVSDAREVADKLAGGMNWTREEVGKGFESLGNGINAVGKMIGGTKVAATFHLDGA